MDNSAEGCSVSGRFNSLSLCTGYGGLDLALEAAVPHARTVAMVEREASVCDILLNRMEEGSLKPCPIWSDLTTFPARRFAGLVDCVIGGYPCQPFSVAGKQRGAEDPRHLWPHITQILRDLMLPEWLWFENVANHLNVGFSEVAGSLQNMGYTVAAGLFEAAEVGASHHRERLFILAHNPGPKWWKIGQSRDGCVKGFINLRQGTGWSGISREVLGHLYGAGSQGRGLGPDEHARQWLTGAAGSDLRTPECRMFTFGPDSAEWERLLVWRPELRPALAQAEIESIVQRVAHGPAATLGGNRTYQLRALGNGVVPLQAAYTLRVLMADLLEYEAGLNALAAAA